MDVTKPIKTQMVYCLECEQEVLLDLGTVDERQQVHTVVEGWSEYGFGADYYPCFGPFTSCPPPDVPEEFDMADEPSGDELFLMNMEAENLLAELEG